MYHLYGTAESLRNLFLLSTRYLGTRPESVAELRRGFRGYLSSRQGQATLGPESEFELVTDPKVENELIEYFREDEFAESDRRVTETNIEAEKKGRDWDLRNHQLESIRKGIEHLQSNSRELGSLFALVYQRLFCFQIPNRVGGTAPQALGVLWACPKRSFTKKDIAEFLVHELTHNLVFIDDLCRPHYRDMTILDLPQNQPLSAIRKTPRRADNVLHSLVVGCEVLRARQTVLGDDEVPKLHPCSVDLLISCRNALRSLLEIDSRAEILTERGREITERCAEVLH